MHAYEGGREGITSQDGTTSTYCIAYECTHYNVKKAKHRCRPCHVQDGICVYSSPEGSAVCAYGTPPMSWNVPAGLMP